MVDELQRRRDLRVVAKLRVFAIEPKRELLGVTRNISLGGMFVFTDRRVQGGEQLALEVEIPQGAVRVEAVVVHRQESGIGCRFVGLSREVEDSLMVLIDTLLVQDARLDDRRRWPRTETRIPISWQQEKNEHEAELRDLTLYGARILSTGSPQSGSEVDVCITPMQDGSSGPGVAHCRARVVHCEGSGFGVEFLAPDHVFLSVLRELLRASY